MKHPVFFPVYNIYSDLVRTAIGLKDTRSIEKFFEEAGIKVHDIGGKKCILCEDLLNITKPKPQVYERKLRKELSQFE